MVVALCNTYTSRITTKYLVRLDASLSKLVRLENPCVHLFMYILGDREGHCHLYNTQYRNT